MTLKIGFAALMVASLLVQPSGGATAAVTLAVPGRSNANVSLAAQGPFLVAVWSASLPNGSTDIYAAVSRDSGASFSAPTRVNAKPGDARANGEQPPRVALVSRAGASPAIVVVWTRKSEIGTTIVSARSDDGARTFGQSTAVPNADAAGNRGWDTIAVDAHGAVHVLWLDHRETAKTMSGSKAEHNHAGHDASATAKRDGVAMAEQSKLYLARLGDAASAQSLLGGVCYCCKTAIVAGPNDGIYLAWRHVYAGNIRDMAFTMSKDGGRTFGPATRVSEDKWQLDGCPEDGPGLAVDAGNQVHVVWSTLVTDAPNGRPSIGIFYARSSDGRVFSPRLRIPTEGVPHHPQILIAGDTLILAWDELKDGVRRAVAARRRLGSETGFARQVVSGDNRGTYPALALAGSTPVVAWTSGGTDSIVRVAVLR